MASRMALNMVQNGFKDCFECFAKIAVWRGKVYPAPLRWIRTKFRRARRPWAAAKNTAWTGLALRPSSSIRVVPSYPKGTQELWLSIFPRKSKRNWGSSGGYEWSFQTTSGDRIGAVGMLKLGGFVEGGVLVSTYWGGHQHGYCLQFRWWTQLATGAWTCPVPSVAWLKFLGFVGSKKREGTRSLLRTQNHENLICYWNGVPQLKNIIFFVKI